MAQSKWYLEEDTTFDTELEAQQEEAEARSLGLFARVVRNGNRVKCWRRHQPR